MRPADAERQRGQPRADQREAGDARSPVPVAAPGSASTASSAPNTALSRYSSCPMAQNSSAWNRPKASWMERSVTRNRTSLESAVPRQCLVATSRRAECLIARRLGEPHRRLRPCIDHGRDPLGLGCGRASGCLTTVGAAVASIRVDALRCLKLTRDGGSATSAGGVSLVQWLRGRAPFASPLVHELRYGGDECRRGDTECYAAIELCGFEPDRPTPRFSLPHRAASSGPCRWRARCQASIPRRDPRNGRAAARPGRRSRSRGRAPGSR